MSNLHIIGDVSEELSNCSVNNTAVLHHQIEKKRIRTVGNISNGAPITKTSSTKFSVISTGQGKSVLSMSLERKDSIQYVPRKIAPSTTPAGQNTVMHLDNYTRFMAQRVTTKTIKTAEIMTEGYSPCSTSTSSNVVDGIVDVNLKVVLDGVDSSYHGNNNKTLLNTNKRKLQDLKSNTPSKIKGHKNSLAVDYKKPKEGNKTVDKKMDKPNASTKIKPTLKKTIANRRKKIIKPIKARIPKIKAKTEVEQMITKKDTGEEEREKIQTPPSTPHTSESKILRPCIYTVQNKKCLSEVNCPYLHSGFPCKYYYLNIPCPLDLKCPFMHNGKLKPELEEALRKHILDLLSTNPSTVETYFVEQMLYIDDLSRRLQSFQLQSFQNNQTENDEVIEVLDDVDDVVLVVDESSNDYSTHNVHDMTAANPLQDTDESPALQPTINKLDEAYENIKATNYTVDELDKKLKLLKTKSDIPPNEKINELQNIYDQLKKQEKRLKVYGNLNTPVAFTEVSATDDNCQNASLPSSLNIDNKKPHVVLVNPYIANAIQTSESQEMVTNLTDDENTDIVEIATQSKVPKVVNTKFLTNVEENVVNLSDFENSMPADEHECLQPKNLNVAQQGAIELITINKLPKPDLGGNTELINFPKDNVNDLNMPSNMDYLDEPTISIDTISSNSSLNVKENYEKPHTSNKVTQILDEESFVNENLVKNNSVVFDKNVSLILHNETLELEITNDEKEAVENNINETGIKEGVDEKSLPYEYNSSTKTKKRCLRSHALQDNEETTNKIAGKMLTPKTPERTKPYRTRRLRLPKPIKKTPEKSNTEECEIISDGFNKPIKSSEDNSKENALLPDAEASLKQNVILTKRFKKRAKFKHEHELQFQEMKAETDCVNRTDINVEQNMSALHSENIESFSRIENIDYNDSLNLSQDHLKVESDNDNMEIVHSDIPTSGGNFDKNQTMSGSFKSLRDFERTKSTKNSNLKRRISFETPTSSLDTLSSTTIKEKFNLGNPQIVLTKLKTPFMLQTTKKDVQADSTTSHVNPIVTSSTPFADDKSKQKRRNITAGYDWDSSPKENTCLKIENSNPVGKVKIDRRKRTLSLQSYDSKDEDCENESIDEKLTIELPCHSNEQKDAFDSFSTSEQQHHHTHQHEHKEQHENESDLRQQIENVSNKSALQIQLQQQNEVGETSTASATATSFITKNKKILPHKQYQEQEKILVEEENDEKDLMYDKPENETEEGEITNASTSCDSFEHDEDKRTQSLEPARIYEPEKLTSNFSKKHSNEITLTDKEEEEVNVEYSTGSSLLNKMLKPSTKREINFENSPVNITPISSPTYENDTIASPSPIRKSIDFRISGEVDGRLRYPPIPYILHEIELGKIEVNKPMFIDKLKKTIQLDPRIFRTHIKKRSIILGKPVETASNALLTMTASSSFNFTSSHLPLSSSMISPYDPRSRTSAIMTNIAATPSLPHETALTPYKSRQTAVASSAPVSSSFFHQDIPNAVPLALQYNRTSQPIIQPQQQQTPNMFLYGCLQRSSWYQTLMSTMKIQINQAISQLVRALNSFHRERAYNPQLVFDVFKIDCAGELLEIMRNLGIFVDAHGVINEQRPVINEQRPVINEQRPVINEQRHVHSCCNEMPLNASYSFIQQFLTPNAHCTSLAAASSCHNSAAGTPVGQLNVNEPIISCYVKAPEPVHKHSNDCVATHQSQHVENNCDRNCNNRSDNSNNPRRYNTQFKKLYDNNSNDNNGNNNYQPRSNQRFSYNNNPRFMKPGSSSPTRYNSSPPNSPKKSFDGGSGSGYGGAGGRGGGGGRGGRFNNNKRFNNYNNNNDNSNGNGSFSWSGSNEKRYNNKYQSNNSPSHGFQSNSPSRSGSPLAAEPKTSSPPLENTSIKSSKPTVDDEECWDSDN